MLNTIIIEDERLARENLLQTFSRLNIDINVKTALTSVAESISYLRLNKKADIIFCDVQLSDGLSFEIFRQVKVEIPVIFITEYDQFVMTALEHNSIDYILKPVDEKALEKAIGKYRMLQNHFSGDSLTAGRLIDMTERRKTRMLVKKGSEHISLPLSEIVLFYSENKIVFVVDNSGKKFLSEKNLSELEMELDETCFFRANRQYIVNLKYVKGFRSYEKVKIKVDILHAEVNEKCNIIISQETAPAFRKWIYEA